MLSIDPSRRAEQLASFNEGREQAWAAGQVHDFPASFASVLMKRWRGQRGADGRAANLRLLLSARVLRRAEFIGVPADANDEQLRQVATDLARDMPRRLSYLDRQASNELADRPPEQRERLLMLGKFLEAMHWMELRGVLHLLMRWKRLIPATLARLGCESFWRRVVRGIHAKAVESTARAVGLVNKRAGCYVSNDGLARRRGQRARNERVLEGVRAVNEHGQDYTLAELAAKGPANRQIRRMELMTRLAGFELIAKECGHAAYFVTITCPSRMHAWRTKRGTRSGVEENPAHDGTTVDQAQAYLCRQWRLFSETCRREGLELYGFRIAEPNHDGTPHWHALVFLPKKPAVGVFQRSGRRSGLLHFDAECMLGRNLRRYFLCGQDSTERGANSHRVTMERIDWTRGSAAGYVAKYVSKNIDGYKVEKDLYGNDALTSSQRVDAWASTWRIRQFQQIGGAPVGVWRELRRLNPEQGAASATVGLALDAVNVTANQQEHATEIDQQQTAAHGWASYLHLQGGHRVARQLQRIRVLRETTGELGRYGELMAPRPVGVVTDEVKRETVGIASFRRVIRKEVESERALWIVVPGGFVEQARERLRSAPAAGEAGRPWSPVNNCTRPAPLFGGPVERIKKRGRWHRWEKGAGGPSESENHGQHPPNRERRTANRS